MRSTMADGADGAATPLDNLTNDQLTQRSLAARGLHSCLEDKTPETWTAYQSYVLPKVKNYLDLIAQEADLTFEVRNSQDALAGLRNQQSVLVNAPPSGKKYWDERLDLKLAIHHKELRIVGAPKALEAIRTKLAAISAQEINSHMSALEVPEGDPLRPPMRNLPPASAERTDSKRLPPRAQEFRDVIAKEWKKRRKGLGRKRTSVDAMKAIAKACDDRKVKPISPFIEPALEEQIHKWNVTHDQLRRIKTFQDIVKQSIEPQPLPRFKLGVFRKFLANCASNFPQKQE